MVTKNEHVTEFELNKFSKKAQDFIKNSSKYINIAEGAVRSGKTICVIYRFLISIIQGTGENHIIAGRTTGTCERNVVYPFLKILKSQDINFEYYSENKIIISFEERYKTIYIFGANDKEAKNKLAGLTVQSALIDEATRVHKSFFQMALTRLSEPNAKMFCTTNPDNSNHWLKTEYIDNQNLINKDKIKTWTFYLTDNLTLTEEVIDNIVEGCRGNSVLYARLIESKWVSSTGLIYSNFDLNNNLLNEIDLNKYSRFDIGCDYGSSNVNVFVLVGTYYENGKSYHDIIDEVVFDAQKNGYEQTDTDRCKDLIRLQEKYNLHNTNYIYVPHDATSLKAAIYQDPNLKMRCVKIKPDTLEYIYTIQDLFYQNRIKVYTKCTETLRSINSYCWDEKQVEKGKDMPDKSSYDHPCDAFRFPIIKRLKNRKIIDMEETVLNI